jgi:PKHD-type hydroxylase
VQAPETRTVDYLTNYVTLPEVFSPEECRRIIYSNIPASQAQVSIFKKGTVNDLQMQSRNTKVKAMPRIKPLMWVYSRIHEQIHFVNEHCYHFKLSELTELQILEYENTGFYGTHLDTGTGVTSRRKISLVVFLTPPEEYDGGELILKPWFTPVVPTQGTIVFFPSYIPHEITPVTRGVRHTLVSWVLGPSYR